MKFTAADIMKLRNKTSAGMGLCKEALEHSDGDFDKAVEYVNERSDVIARLHNLTGAKLGLSKIAYQDAGQDFEKAVEIIKERGWAEEGADELAADSEGPVEGVIGVYVHGVDQKTVGLAEVSCKTDFVAKNEAFKKFAYEIAMQVAAMKPVHVSRDDIAPDKLEKLMENFKKEAEAEGKPANIMEKIVEGKLNKYMAEKCLLEQKWFKDESKTMQSYLDEAMGQLGEPLKIRRVLCWKMGE